MNFLSSHGMNLIIVHKMIHLGTDSCYCNDYLYHVIIIIIIIITITCTA